MIWMISLRMFFIFEVEVLEVLGSFKAWFQQSFWTSQSGSSLALQLQPFLSLSLASLKCLRKASIYRSLEVGERHVAESNW